MKGTKLGQLSNETTQQIDSHDGFLVSFSVWHPSLRVVTFRDLQHDTQAIKINKSLKRHIC